MVQINCNEFIKNKLFLIIYLFKKRILGILLTPICLMLGTPIRRPCALVDEAFFVQAQWACSLHT